MNRTVLKPLCAAAAAALLAMTALPASADALHGFCGGAGVASSCTDNGTNTPTSANPPAFGFWLSSGPATGDFLIDILTPNNVSAPSSFSISGSNGGVNDNANISASATLQGTWSSGSLATFLGLSGATPNNPIGAFSLPATATGFSVFQADLGTNTILAQNNGLNPTGPLLSLGSSLPQYSYVLAFLVPASGSTTATANSGALYETGTPVPEPGVLGLMGLAVAASGFALRLRKRQPEVG